MVKIYFQSLCAERSVDYIKSMKIDDLITDVTGNIVTYYGLTYCGKRLQQEDLEGLNEHDCLRICPVKKYDRTKLAYKGDPTLNQKAEHIMKKVGKFITAFGHQGLDTFHRKTGDQYHARSFVREHHDLRKDPEALSVFMEFNIFNAYMQINWEEPEALEWLHKHAYFANSLNKIIDHALKSLNKRSNLNPRTPIQAHLQWQLRNQQQLMRHQGPQQQQGHPYQGQGYPYQGFPPMAAQPGQPIINQNDLQAALAMALGQQLPAQPQQQPQQQQFPFQAQQQFFPPFLQQAQQYQQAFGNLPDEHQVQQPQLQQNSEQQQEQQPSQVPMDQEPAPSQEQPAEVDYSEQIARLHDCGFTDDALNRLALEQTNGDVESAVEFIIQMLQ